MLGLSREDDNIRDPDLGCDPRHGKPRHGALCIIAMGETGESVLF